MEFPLVSLTLNSLSCRLRTRMSFASRITSVQIHQRHPTRSFKQNTKNIVSQVLVAFWNACLCKLTHFHLLGSFSLIKILVAEVESYSPNIQPAVGFTKMLAYLFQHNFNEFFATQIPSPQEAKELKKVRVEEAKQQPATWMDFLTRKKDTLKNYTFSHS